MRYLKTNNKNWKKLCQGEIKAKQLEINFKEVKLNMEMLDKVKIISIDQEDEKRGIQIGNLGVVELIQKDLVYVLLKTGLAKGSIYTLKDEQLEVVKDDD